jgi:hypothetical protein
MIIDSGFNGYGRAALIENCYPPGGKIATAGMQTHSRDAFRIASFAGEELDCFKQSSFCISETASHWYPKSVVVFILALANECVRVAARCR